jgi:hypothetical protein
MKSIKNSTRKISQRVVLLLSVLFILFAAPQMASAHCDSYDGPVIKDALKALEQQNVELVLKWVEPKYDKIITEKFNQTLKLQGSNEEVNEIIRTHFLETLVRLHREGEGASFTGLKPIGSMTPMVEMADNSLDKNDIDYVVDKVNNHLGEVLRERFTKAMELSKSKDNSVEQGRAYVEAYVEYTHTLEALEHIMHGSMSH